MPGYVCLSGHHGPQTVQGGVDAGGGIRVDHFTGGVYEGQKPGAWGLFAHQGEVQPALAAAPLAEGDEALAFDDLHGDA